MIGKSTSHQSLSPARGHLVGSLFRNLVQKGLVQKGLCWLAAVLLLVNAGCDSEKANWNLARAINANRAGEFETAIEHLKLAAKQDPTNGRIRLLMARIYAENGHGEIGVSLCDDLQACFPPDSDTDVARSLCLQYLGKFEESLASYKRSLSGKVARSPVELNNLAYYRALAKRELDRAAVDIQQAIETTDQEPWGAYSLRLPLQVKTVIAAGLLSRSCEAQQDVLPLLSHKIEQFEELWKQRTNQLHEAIAKQIRQVFPLPLSNEQRLLQLRTEIDSHAACLVTMLATRALLFNDQNDFDAADRDRYRMVELGAEFDTIAERLPAESVCLSTLADATMYLDTRGFIAALRPWGDPGPSEMLGLFPQQPASYELALDDLNLAVLASEINQRAIDSSLYNSSEIPANTISRRKAIGKHFTAVLVFHRLTAHQRYGNLAAAAHDQKKIESLGFPPDANLF